MADAAQVDLIHAFAYPLPLTVICELLGVPVDRRREFRDWSSIVVTGVLAGTDTYVAATTAMVNYLRELIEAKRTTPADDWPVSRAASRWAPCWPASPGCASRYPRSS